MIFPHSIRQGDTERCDRNGLGRAEKWTSVSPWVSAMYPRARVELFGSGATGLALQDADIDLVVLGAGPTTTEGGGGYNRHDREDLVKILRKISKALQTGRVVQKATVISTAKIPIVKMNAGGLAAGAYTRPLFSST